MVRHRFFSTGCFLHKMEWLQGTYRDLQVQLPCVVRSQLNLLVLKVTQSVIR